MSDKPVSLRDTEDNDWNGERDRILELYARRQSITYIAQAIGRSAGYVSRILHSEFAERNKNRQNIVVAHQQTLSWLIQKTTERVHNAKDKWDRRDAELLLRLLERESRLFGLDQPTQHQVKVEVDQLSEEELLDQLRVNGFEIIAPIPTTATVLPALPPPIEDDLPKDTPNE